MDFRWVITKEDCRSYRDFIEQHRSHELVKERILRNVKHRGVMRTPEEIWRVLVGCLLTTKQRSGPGSQVGKFLESGHPLLNHERCRRSRALAGFVRSALSKHGLRRNEMIAKEVVHAVNWLDTHGWDPLLQQLDTLASHTTVKKERAVARFIQNEFMGFGPKQSRNLIQWLGFSKYEIPLDSRIVKVLRSLNFPVPLSPTALADEAYYCFIEDGIQLVMQEVGEYPCVFDACAFASLQAGKRSNQPR